MPPPAPAAMPRPGEHPRIRRPRGTDGCRMRRAEQSRQAMIPLFSPCPGLSVRRLPPPGREGAAPSPGLAVLPGGASRAPLGAPCPRAGQRGSPGHGAAAEGPPRARERRPARGLGALCGASARALPGGADGRRCPGAAWHGHRQGWARGHHLLCAPGAGSGHGQTLLIFIL